MLQVVQPTPVEEAIKALEAARAKAQCEVIKIEAALSQLRPGPNQSAMQSQYGGIGGVLGYGGTVGAAVGAFQGGNAQ